MNEEELERLSAALDEVSILDLKKCEALPDPESNELCWFRHPDYENVFAKFGPSKKGRPLRVWLYKCDDHVVILSVNFATKPELHYLATLNSKN